MVAATRSLLDDNPMWRSDRCANVLVGIESILSAARYNSCRRRVNAR